MCIVLVCGLGHVIGSIALGMAGIGLGLSLGLLESIEAARGALAARMLIAGGLLYFLWGLRHAYRRRSHAHAHAHDGGLVHAHAHTHQTSHVHAHADASARSLTPWVLFTVFIFGPCEPLIPLLMYPAATHNLWGLVLVVGTFATVTLATMLAAVWLGTTGLDTISIRRVERYGHALAGFSILICGASIELLGL